MLFLESRIFFLLPLYKTFFFLNNKFWISYWKALKAFALFPLCFALMNTFRQWSGRVLVPSGRQSVLALQITTGLPAFNLMVFVYIIFVFFCSDTVVSSAFVSRIFQCNLPFNVYISTHALLKSVKMYYIFFRWCSEIYLSFHMHKQSKITPRNPRRQSSLWFNKRLTYQNYWTGVCCTIISLEYWFIKPILRVALSKACVGGLSINGIAGSNSAEAWMLVSCGCCVVSGRGLRRDST